MFYFTKISIDNSPLIDAEAAIRKYSIKRHVILDIQSSASNITEDKYFLGNDNKSDLAITRIRTSFEWLFPKLIVSISKNPDYENFKIRYCVPSLAIFLYSVFMIGLSIYYSIRDNEIDENIFSWLIFLSVFLILTALELKLTKRKINKAIEDYGKMV